MAQNSDGEHGHDTVSSKSLTVETTKTQRQRLTHGGTLTCPPPELPTLPFDLLPEILCRLPVKLLGQLRCLCKSFNSLFSDPKFAKKHLQLSTKRHHLMATSMNNLCKYVQYDTPIPSVFSTSPDVTQTQLYPPNSIRDRFNYVTVMCSCDGILFGEVNVGSYFLWNPSIRKFKLLPPLEIPCQGVLFNISFGYDRFIDNYKVIVVSEKNEVFINTLGSKYWRRIGDIPNDYIITGKGRFVSDTVNWLEIVVPNMHFIVSLDLENESYQELLLPDSENDLWVLGVVRDCLCLFAISDKFFDVWIMKEYGNKESWTKLYSVPTIQVRGFKAFDALYISKDDQLLLKFFKVGSGDLKLVVYDSKTGTSNILKFQNNYHHMCPIVYIESLISP